MSSKLQIKSTEQILEVIQITRNGFRAGLPIKDSYNTAVQQVSQKYRRTYQTIADGCTRRLGSIKAEKFRELLMESFSGNHDPLISTLKKHSLYGSHKLIDKFFSNQNPIQSKNKNNLSSEVFSFRLNDTEAKKIRTIASIQGITVQEWITNTVTDSANKKLKAWAKEILE